ncbi:ROK family transcriptional regulator [Mesorhizobium sp. M0119]|uniref:ROK family transcriptional regulator n=2 Tax=Mesorhizobium TaxID=68287 RepID=UPI0033358709
MNENALRSLLGNATSAFVTSQIVRALCERGPLSAAQVARLTGLARSTVSTAVAELKLLEIVIEGPATNSTPRAIGRPATPLTLNPRAGTCVGVHLNQQDIRLAIADVSHSVILEKSIEVEPGYSPQCAAAVVRDIVTVAYGVCGLDISALLGVGVSVCGPVSPGGMVQRANGMPTWAGVNISQIFGAVLEKPVFADNESNCSALAEMMWGAAAGYEDFVLLKLDLGVGGAIVRNGKVITGVAGGGGEFGHMSIEPNGGLCRCGNRGCLEVQIGVDRSLQEMSRLYGRIITIYDVSAMASQGDVGARRMIEDMAEQAGRGLALIGTIINPPLVIVSGRMTRAGDMLLKPLVAVYEKHTLMKARDVPSPMRTRVMIGKLAENDAVLGAVGLALRGLAALP